MTTKDFFKKFENKKYLELLPSIKEEKTQAYITIVLTLLALSVFGIFAINPTLSTIAQLNKELEDNEIIYKKLNEKIADLSLLQEKYSSLEKDLPFVFASFPRETQCPLLIGQIKGIAAKTNVQVKRISTSEVELMEIANKEKYSSYIFSAEVIGNYQEIMNFVSLLGDYERIVTLENISINKASEVNNLQLIVKGKAYFKK